MDKRSISLRYNRRLINTFLAAGLIFYLLSRPAGIIPVSEAQAVIPIKPLSEQQKGARGLTAGNSSPDAAGDILKRKIAVMESVGGGPLTEGNMVVLLIDGPATYAAMLEAIQNAKDHINLETFGIDDDAMGRRFADMLLKKQSEGVRVNLMYDSAGSFHAPYSFFERLRKGGIRVLEFNPINPFKARGGWRLMRRDHRKILIVDGRVAITGGINISEIYSTGLFPGGRNSKSPQMSWRDTDVQIEGPAVAEFQRLFLEEWKNQKGPKLSGENYFPYLDKKGADEVRVLGSSPGRMSEVMYRMYLSAIDSSEKSVHLTNSYFVPDERTQKALMGAAARGVDVKIILPAFSDVPHIFYAERYYFSDLIKSGVKLYNRRDAILHAKTAVIDGVWSTVGSTNLDAWSFFYNNEDNAVILSRRFAAEMEKMFNADLRESTEINPEHWERRPFLERLREWLAHLFAKWL